MLSSALGPLSLKSLSSLYQPYSITQLASTDFKVSLSSTADPQMLEKVLLWPTLVGPPSSSAEVAEKENPD